MPRPAPPSLELLVDVETPEQVVFSYTVAGVGSRAAAALIDYAICLLFLIGISVAAAPLMRGEGGGSSWWVVAVVLLLVFGVFWGYYVVFEGLWDGQTPGKRRLGLRVVRDGGYSITFAASAVRNLVRFVDMQPGLSYGVGILSVVLSPAGKRLGDYAAGTIVVRERAVTAASGGAPPRPPPTEGSLAGASAGQPAALSASLTDEEYALLDRFIARRQSLDLVHRVQLTAQVAARLRDRLPDAALGDEAALRRLHDLERTARARGSAGRSDTGAAREQHAIVAQGGARWREFASMLATAQRRGLAGMSEAEVSDFVGRYRELAGDLARLQTAARGREIDSVFYLSRLVGGGHNLLYRERPLSGAAVWDFLTITVPREIRRSALPIGLAAVLLFGPAAIAWVGVARDPAVAAEFLPQTMLDRADEGVERARRGTGYIPDPHDKRPTMASAILTNNVQVTYLTFAGGMLAGVGTVLLLVFNGIELGGVLGLYQAKGILPLILAFVAPHGVLELSAIAIAGGGGLLLASALLLPGAMTRREALVARGVRAIRLIAGSSLLLVLAGTLEGFISPIPWWTLREKLTVSALTALLLLLYVNLDRGRSPRAVPRRIRPAGAGGVAANAAELGARSR